jgi:hypothetical protein
VHPAQRLIRSAQSAVFPYDHARRCCVVLDGERCDRRVGFVYNCPHEDEEGEEDCSYAVCDQHFRVGWRIRLIARFRALISEFLEQPISWMLSFAFVSLATAAYVPIVSTAVMVVSCHPQYQCVFEGCWADPSTRFAAAAYLAVLVLVTYGIGFPIAVIVMLLRRQAVLRTIFLSPFYLGKYAALDMDPIAAGKGGGIATESQTPASFIVSTITQTLLLRICRLLPTQPLTSVLETACAHAQRHARSVAAGAASLVDPVEFERFLQTDPSVLQVVLYGDFRFERLPSSAVLTYGRVLMLLGPLLLDRGSLAQLVAVAAGEVAFCVLAVSLDVYASGWLLMVSMLGSVHQFVYIGLQAYTTAVSYERDVSETTGQAMVITTLTYIALVVVISIGVMCWDTVARQYRQRRLANFFSRLGLTNLRNAPLLLMPVANPVDVTTTVDVTDHFGQYSVANSESTDDDGGVDVALHGTGNTIGVFTTEGSIRDQGSAAAFTAVVSSGRDLALDDELHQWRRVKQDLKRQRSLRLRQTAAAAVSAPRLVEGTDGL